MRCARGVVAGRFLPVARGVAAPQAKSQKVEFENPLILLVEKKVSSLQSMLPLLEQARLRPRLRPELR